MAKEHAVAAKPETRLEVHLHRFQLNPDHLEEFQRWVEFEHEHHEETLATLEREKMYVEAIFRDPEHAPTTIYWLEVHGPGGAQEKTSPLAIDKVYDQFMQDTLVPHSRKTLEPEYVLVPDFLSSAIHMHETSMERK